MTRLLLLLTFTLTACTSSRIVDAPDTPAPESGERLLATVPPNLESTYRINSPNTRISEFVPKGQDMNNWDLKLSFESVRSEEIPGDPISLLLSEVEADRGKCNFVQHFNIHSGYENNYETSVRLFLCGENAFTEQGEVKLMKVIRAENYLYSIRVIRRVVAFEINEADVTRQEVAVWSNYLSKITVCDDSVAHPCPEPAPL